MNDDETVVEYAPAYGTAVWDGQTGGPSCGQVDDFCYLCTHFELQNNEDEDTEDWVARMKALITTEFEEKKERSRIVHDVYEMYQKFIRPTTSWKHPQTGCVVPMPTWTKSSIDRHLLYSLNWPDCQEQTILHTFTAILENQNATMREKASNEIIETKRQAWCDTVKAYKEFMIYRRGGRAGKSKHAKTKSG